MNKYVVTPRGANELMVDGSRPAAGSVIDTTGWQTVPTLVAQGFLKELVELPKEVAHLPDYFPHKDVLENRGYRSLEAVHYLTDQQLIDLPEIGEAGVRDIRASVAHQRGEKPRSYADDLATLPEIGHVAFWHSEDMDTPALERPEDYVVLVADRGNVAAAVAAIRSHMLTEHEQVILQLASADAEPTPILEAMREEGYKLSEPLTLLLERLGLTYPPPEPATPDAGDVPPPAELQHPTTDSDEEAKGDESKQAEAKAEGKTEPKTSKRSNRKP